MLRYVHFPSLSGILTVAFQKVLSSVKLANKYDYLYDIIKPYLGEGLVSASGPNHKKHRRIIQPHLNLNFCANVLSILQKHINFHLTLLDTKYCQNNNDDEYFDICTDNHKCFVDFVCEVFMGTKINAQKGENKKFIQAAIDMYRLGINKMTKPWLRFNFIYKMTKEYKHDMLALKEFRRFGEKVSKTLLKKHIKFKKFTTLRLYAIRKNEERKGYSTIRRWCP